MKNKISINSIQDCTDLAGRRVFLRGALNVPVKNGEIVDDYRLQKLLPTIQWLRQQNARVILAGHMSGNEDNSFKPVFTYLKEHFDLTFITDYMEGVAGEEIDAMQNGEVVLLENLRQYDGEKANDLAFTQMLAKYADVYVNDAFPASHREHASIIGLPQHLPAYAGLQFIKEYEALRAVLNPEHPFVFILGGAKFSTKLPLVEKFSSVADQVFVGGALANAYIAAAGKSIGDSVTPEEEPDLSSGLASEALRLPIDVLTLSEDAETAVKPVDEVADGDVIVDLGPETLERMVSACEEANLIVWNGPLGWYEKGYSEATDKLATVLKKVAGKTILGGGDTVAVILDDMSPDDFSFVSTAGGAMITFLSEETLPGIEALRRK